MCSGGFWRRMLVGAGAVLALIALPALTFAQGAQGVLRGTVTDEKGQPIEGAKVTITQASDATNKWETTTTQEANTCRPSRTRAPI